MNTIVNRIAFVAASAFVLATSAFGQSVLKADVPFDFRTTSAALPAGEYVVRQVMSTSGASIESISSVATQHTVMVVSSLRDSSAAGSAALMFRCASEGCSLVAIRTASGTLTFLVPHSKRDAEVALVTIPMRTYKAD